MKSDTLREAARLHAMGLGVHWLHPKSKRPIENGWTNGPRQSWEELKSTFHGNYNVGVRLGSASLIDGKPLAVIDVDVKSTESHHKKEAYQAARDVLERSGLGFLACPIVESGRGNGSRHYYCVTSTPFKTFNPAKSTEVLKIYYPSKPISKLDKEHLSEKELGAGFRMGHAWEISLYSFGRQVVLPPSIHPDSGRPYAWKRVLSDTRSLPLLDLDSLRVARGPVGETKPRSNPSAAEFPGFEVEDVSLHGLGLPASMVTSIMKGTGVTDRSAFLLPASASLLSRGLTQNQVLTVLTDPELFLGECGYDHAKTTDRVRAARWVWNYTLKRVAHERDAVRVFKGREPDRTELTGDALKKQTLSLRHEAGTDDWRGFIIRTGKDKDGPPKSTIQNIKLILCNAVSPQIFKRDTFTYRDIYGVSTPWGAKEGDLLGDDDVSKMKLWLDENYGFQPGDDMIYHTMTVVACENAFDPVLEWLTGLPEWDRVPRLDTWLCRHFEAEGNPEYNAQVFRKWMVAMVGRILVPGMKFDWMPIFEGPQGVGKSSFGRLLVGDRYFLDWLPNLADKDASQGLQGVWAVEMGELATMRKNEIEIVKSYLTRTVDKFRPPFGKRAIESPRRCVFYGTTNREQFLQDDTGNRRFKPVKVGKLDFEALERDRLQLFAEAKYLFEGLSETEESLHLTGQAHAYELVTQKQKMVADDSTMMLELFLDFVKFEMKKPEEERFSFKKFSLHSLFQGGNPFREYPLNGRNAQFGSKALKMAGAKSWKSDGRMVWRFDDFHQKSINREGF